MFAGLARNSNRKLLELWQKKIAWPSQGVFENTCHNCHGCKRSLRGMRRTCQGSRSWSSRQASQHSRVPIWHSTYAAGYNSTSCSSGWPPSFPGSEEGAVVWDCKWRLTNADKLSYRRTSDHRQRRVKKSRAKCCDQHAACPFRKKGKEGEDSRSACR